VNSMLAAMVNGAVLSVPIAAAVWSALRLAPRRALNSATRYAVWWATLLVAIALPLVYLPHFSISRAAPPTNVRKLNVANPVVPVAVVTTPPSVIAPPSRSQRWRIELPPGRWPQWIFIGWIAASMFMLARLAASYISLGRRKAAAFAAPAHMAACVDEWLDRCGTTRRGIRVASAEDIAAPLAAGPLHPAILIPAKFFDQLTEDEIEQIGLHEAAHLARRDDYALMLQRVIEALFALHPVVRWIERRIDLEREIACDDLVVAATGRARDYAACLTRVVELSGFVRASLAAAGVTGKSPHLTRRVEMLLDKSHRAGTRLLKARLTLIALALAALAGVAARTPGLIAFAAPTTPMPIARPPLPPSSPETPAALRPAPRLLAQAAAPPVTRPPDSTPPAVFAIDQVQVTDREGRDIADLAQQDFQVFEDNAVQPISVFQRVDVSVGIVLNIHDETARQQWQEALSRVVTRIKPMVQISIFPYDKAPSDSRAVLDLTSAVLNRLKYAPASRRSLLLISDQPDSFPPLEGAAEANVEVSSATVFSPTGLEAAVSGMTPSALSFYMIGYVPQNTTQDGKFQQINVGQIKVVVDRPNLIVRSRTGRY
jgi:beta-lactamase regulating signal transducer with metallopeptidase domain